MSAERFERLGKRVSLAIYFGHRFVYSEKGKNEWKVQVEFIDSGTKIEFEQTGPYDLEILLHDAYNRLDSLVSFGLGKQAMMPALEAPPPAPETTDDIPF